MTMNEGQDMSRNAIFSEGVARHENGRPAEDRPLNTDGRPAEDIALDKNGLPVDPKSLEGREFMHFKGNCYRLEAFAIDSETCASMVVYRPLYGEKKLWVRPAKMFFESVRRPDYQGPRFRLLPHPTARSAVKS